MKSQFKNNLSKPALWLYQFKQPLHLIRLLAQLLKRHRWRGGLHRYRCLPPGSFRPIDHMRFRKQTFLLDQMHKYGPIFRHQTRTQLIIHITDTKQGRALLTQHKSSFTSSGKAVEHLFSAGHLRGMEGEVHRHYRRILVHALRAEVINACESDIRQIVCTGLTQMSNHHPGQAVENAQLVQTYRAIFTRIMLRLLFGVDESHSDIDDLVCAYDRFSDGISPVFEYVQAESEAFRDIRAIVASLIHAYQSDRQSNESVLKRLVASDNLEASVVGNLIYMVESGRFDMYSLMRWTTRYLCHTTAVVDLLRANIDADNDSTLELSQAIVFETLRCDQSEAITRELLEDIEFEGYYFPKGSFVQVCMWEAHKSEKNFPQPFSFDPSRFVDKRHPLDTFAPFGVDHHRCIAGDYIPKLGAWFVEELVAGFDWQLVRDGTPVRGPYHWEPNPEFSIYFSQRATQKSGRI